MFQVLTNNPLMISAIAFLIVVAGFYLSYLYGRKTKEFHWSEYVALMSGPLLAVFFVGYLVGVKVLYLFLLSMGVGFILEYVLGLAYHKILNRRLWTYKKYNLGGYTSYLTLPMWGVAGIVFYLIILTVGL